MRWIVATLALWALQPAPQADPYREFRQWFSSQEAIYFNLDITRETPERERRFDELQARLQGVHPELTFEFGPVELYACVASAQNRGSRFRVSELVVCEAYSITYGVGWPRAALFIH